MELRIPNLRRGSYFLGSLEPRRIAEKALTAVIQEAIGHPNVLVRIVEGYSSYLVQQVRDGEVAFAVVPALPDSTGLRAGRYNSQPWPV